MMRFLRSRIHPDAKKSEKEEYFEYSQTIQHGFASKACCLSYDAKLDLLAIGTKNGYVKIFGAPGVEFSGEHESNVAVSKLFFLSGQGRLISLCQDQTVHLWEVNFRDGQGFLDHVKDIATEGKLKTISSSVIQRTETEEKQEERLLIGTESGNVYDLNTKTFEIKDYIIYQDAIVQSIPEDYKISTVGAVECLAVNPADPTKLLLGFNRGLVVLWDCESNSVEQTYISEQSIETLHWHSSGEKFMSAHNDGSYVVWSTGDNSKPMLSPNIPFGPFPCKPIDQLVWKTTTTSPDNELLLFTGGMPRASYGDRFTVAAQGTKNVVFDFSSKVMDMITIDANMAEGVDDPHTLIILCEEELVAIDLSHNDWLQLRLPYLLPLHASPITACQHVSACCQTVLETIKSAGESQASGKFKFSQRQWPINGGKVNENVKEDTDLLVTGHENGSVKFWNAGSASMTLIYVLDTAKIFDGYEDPLNSQPEEDEWPPFRKVGQYDPFSDDPRFGIQKVLLDPATGTLVVGGTAGQTTIYELNSEVKEMTEISLIEVEVVTDRECFVWKGHEKLKLKEETHTFEPGFSPKTLVQADPPAAVTALAVQAEWGVVGIGTAHGFSLVDFVQGKAVISKCLLSAEELAAHEASALEGAMTRFKSFKKSLRDSFRRRRRTGGQSPRKTRTPSPVEPKESPKKETPKEKEDEKKVEEIEQKPTESEIPEATASAPTEVKSSPKKESPKTSPKKDIPFVDEDEGVKPVERAIESRTEHPEVLPSLVRCLYFAKTYATSATSRSNTFWVGTNGGAVMLYLVTLPEGEKRETDEVQCQLAKEIRLRHGAPVLSICVIDAKDFPIDWRQPKETTTEGGHRVVICSEEQLKSFSLPTLKPSRHKYKLTANEGSRIRKVQYANVQSKNDAEKWESFIVTMTNQGEVQTFAVRTFKRYLKTVCTKSADVSGILSTVFTQNGEGFFLRPRGCEWQRFTVSSQFATRPQCSIDLPEGARPQPPEPVPEVAPEPKKDDEGKTESESAAEAPADTSALSTESGPNTTLPTDITVDSIRDYTQESTIVETAPVESGEQQITVMTTKTTVTTSDQGDVIVVEKKEEHMVNGDAEDEITKLKDEIKKMATVENGDHQEAVQTEDQPQPEVVAQ